MKRVLVTGASGFIGQHIIARLLQDGIMVRALVRDGSPRPGWCSNVEIVEGDVRNSSPMESIADHCDTVFHLASKVHDLKELEDTGEHKEVTIKGTQNLRLLPEKMASREWYFLVASPFMEQAPSLYVTKQPLVNPFRHTVARNYKLNRVCSIKAQNSELKCVACA